MNADMVQQTIQALQAMLSVEALAARLEAVERRLARVESAPAAAEPAIYEVGNDYARAAAYLGIAEETLRDYVCQRIIGFYKLGPEPKAGQRDTRRVRFSRAHLEEFLKEKPRVKRKRRER